MVGNKNPEMIGRRGMVYSEVRIGIIEIYRKMPVIEIESKIIGNRKIKGRVRNKDNYGWI